jgi:hypothetical protein
MVAAPCCCSKATRSCPGVSIPNCLTRTGVTQVNLSQNRPIPRWKRPTHFLGQRGTLGRDGSFSHCEVFGGGRVRCCSPDIDAACTASLRHGVSMHARICAPRLCCARSTYLTARAAAATAAPPYPPPVQNGYLSSRSGCHNRWHLLVHCDHADSTTSRFDSPAPPRPVLPARPAAAPAMR